VTETYYGSDGPKGSGHTPYRPTTTSGAVANQKTVTHQKKSPALAKSGSRGARRRCLLYRQ